MIRAGRKNSVAPEFGGSYDPSQMRAVILAVLFAAGLTAGDPARDARWQQDVAYLGAQLPVRHPDFYSIVPQAQFRAAVDGLYGAVPNMSDPEVMAGLARIVAMANDGHTGLYLTQRNSVFHQLPLRFQWFQDGLFVTGAGDGYTQALGQKVVQIGDVGVDDAYAAIVPIVSHENDIWVRFYSPIYLANADILQALKIAPDNTVIRFVLQDLSGKQFSLDVQSLAAGITPALNSLPAGSAGFTPSYRRQIDQKYWFTYSEASHLLYVAYNQCANMTNLPFTQFNMQVWAAFDSNPVETMVVDLRNNSGGDSSIFNPFLAAKSQRSARFAKVRFYVIIGRQTYSSAILNAISMQQGAAGTTLKLVGEPTGGSPNSYGEVQSMVLPNSQLSIGYSTRYFSFPQYPPGSMLPDVMVAMTSADYFARHDPFLAAVLADGPRNSRTASTGDFLVANAASLRTDLPVAPGALASLFGDFANGTVFVNGVVAQTVAAAPRQINFQIPADASVGSAIFEVRVDGSVIGSANGAIAATAPGLFVSDWLDTARPAAAAGGLFPGAELELLGTGQGTSNLQPAVYFGADRGEVLWSAADTDVPGLWRVRVRVPDNPGAVGQVPVFVTVGGAASNGVTVQVNR